MLWVAAVALLVGGAAVPVLALASERDGTPVYRTLVLAAHHDRASPALSDRDLDRRNDEDDQDYARRLFDRGLIISLESIVTRAQTLRPGGLLEVELERKHGRLVYEVEILDAHGQAWELKFDAKDGRLLKEEREDH